MIEKALKVGFSAAEADAYATKNVGLKDEVAEANLKSEIGAKANRDRALYIADIDGNAVVNQINAYQSSAYQSALRLILKSLKKFTALVIIMRLQATRQKMLPCASMVKMSPKLV